MIKMVAFFESCFWWSKGLWQRLQTLFRWTTVKESKVPDYFSFPVNFSIAYSIPVGPRLICKVDPEHTDNGIFWTDGDDVEHRMIVLSHFQQMVTQEKISPEEKDEELMLSQWLDEDPQMQMNPYICKGLEMTEREISVWLEGWQPDGQQPEQQTETETGGHSSTA